MNKKNLIYFTGFAFILYMLIGISNSSPETPLRYIIGGLIGLIIISVMYVVSTPTEGGE